MDKTEVDRLAEGIKGLEGKSTEDKKDLRYKILKLDPNIHELAHIRLENNYYEGKITYDTASEAHKKLVDKIYSEMGNNLVNISAAIEKEKPEPVGLVEKGVRMLGIGNKSKEVEGDDIGAGTPGGRG